MEASEHRIVWNLGHRLSALEIGVVVDNLAEEEIKSIVGKGGIHEGLRVGEGEVAAVIEVVVLNTFIKFKSLDKGGIT